MKRVSLVIFVQNGNKLEIYENCMKAEGPPFPSLPLMRGASCGLEF